MKQVNINSIPDAKYDKLKRIADSKDIKVSTLCRIWISERLEKKK